MQPMSHAAHTEKLASGQHPFSATIRNFGF